MSKNRRRSTLVALGLGSGISLTQPHGFQIGEVSLQRKTKGPLLEDGDMDSKKDKNSSARNRDNDNFLQVTYWDLCAGYGWWPLSLYSSGPFCATEAEKIKLHFPDCMQLGFWVHTRSCHLDPSLWDLKSGSEVGLWHILVASGQQSYEMPMSHLQVHGCWEEIVEIAVAEFHIPVSRLGWWR